MQTGTRIGPWEVLGELGRGGCGVVLRARRSDGQLAALKLLLEAIDPQAQVRFERELRILRGVSSPALVRVLDQGRTEQGLPWLAMELLPGGTLRERVARGGQLDVDDALTLGRRLAEALAALHAAQVVHRDLKPENVLFDAQGAACLADLGLGRRFTADASQLTRTGALLGTPAYMAPEQFEGGAAGPPTDVWAWGSTLYFALLGRRPFNAETPLELLHQVLRGTPPAPRTLRPELDPQVEALLLACLEKDPARRPPDGAALLAALAALEQGPRAVAPAPRASRAPRAALGVGLLLGAACLAAWWSSRAPESSLPPTPAPRPPREDPPPARPPVEPEPAVALQELLDEAARLATAGRGPEAIDKATAAVDATRGAAQARPLAARSILFTMQERLDLAESDARRALELDPDCPQGHQALGIVLARDARTIPAALRALDTALRLDPGLQLARLRRLHLYLMRGRVDEALADLDLILGVDPDAIEVRLTRVEALLRQRRREEALTDLDHVLRLDPDRVAALTMRGQILRDLARFPEALRDLDRALELDPQSSAALLARAHSLGNMGRMDEALRTLERALPLARRPAHEAQVLALRGGLLRTLDPEQARIDLDRAIALDPGASQAQALRAELRLSQGDPGGALADAEQILRREPDHVLALSLRGEILINRGDPRGRLDLERSVELDPRNDRGLFLRGVLRAKEGDLLGARADLQASLGLTPDASWAEQARLALAEVERRLETGR